jgi:hypothetical protein
MILFLFLLFVCFYVVLQALLAKYPPSQYPWLPPLGIKLPGLTPQPPNPPSRGSRFVPIVPERLLGMSVCLLCFIHSFIHLLLVLVLLLVVVLLLSPIDTRKMDRMVGAEHAYSLQVTGRFSIPPSATVLHVLLHHHLCSLF